MAWLALMAVGACGFETSSPGSEGIPAQDAAGDTAGDTNDDTNDAPSPATGACAETDGLLACYALDGDFNDATGNAPAFLAKGDPVFVGGPTGRAVMTNGDTEIHVENGEELSSGSLTVEAWVNPSVLPSSRAGIFDSDGQWGAFLLSDGRINCKFRGEENNADVTSVQQTEIGQWHHVLCAFHAESGDSFVFVDGVLDNHRNGSPQDLVEDFGDSTALAGNAPQGDPFVGLLDTVRIWDHAREPE